MEMLPPDQKLHIFHERLQASRAELQNERILRQQLEQETLQLKSSLVSCPIILPGLSFMTNMKIFKK